MKAAVASVLLALAIACLMAERGNAISCGDVGMSLVSCVPYLTGEQPKPSVPCCNGVRKLRDMAKTTADKQSACECMKTAAARLHNIKDENAKALPAQCGAPVPFPISSGTDCSKVH